MNPIHEMLITQGKMNDPDPTAAPEIEPKQLTISSQLPDMVDQYITARAQRLALAKEVESLEELEKDLYKTIISKMREGGITAMGGQVGLVKLHKDVDPVATDWPQVWEYIKGHNAFELLHKRLTVTAVKERWESGEEIPGVGRVDKYSLSVSKS